MPSADDAALAVLDRVLVRVRRGLGISEALTRAAPDAATRLRAEHWIAVAAFALKDDDPSEVAVVERARKECAS